MKKRIALLLTAALTVGMLATGCTNTGGSSDVKVGLGIHTSLTDSKNFPDNYGSGAANADLYMAAVKLDADGKIVDVVIDAVQVTATFDATGTLTNEELNATFSTKRELGLDYGMKDVSASMGKIPNGAEWFEQANAFEAFCKDKTVDEIKTMGITDDGKATDERLLTGCTIGVTEMQKAVIKACENASWEGAASGDTLGLGVTAKLSASDTASATTEANGKAQAYVTVAATTTNADGKITCAVVDCVKADSTWDTAGVITTDVNAEIKTSYEKKEAYGMKDVSASIGNIAGGAEWYEQANAFIASLKDKTASDVAAMPLDESGKTTDERLLTGCTITISDMVASVADALETE